jgi:NAD(P)-dependent dehydrogenase (short-subunit alcohol dehydrogenase family)
VTDIQSIIAAKEHIEKAEGHLDVLVNNAGMQVVILAISKWLTTWTAIGSVGKTQSATDIDVSGLREVYETNFLGLVQTTTTFMPLLRKSRRAVILNVTSELGSNSFQANWEIYIPAVAYTASKAAVNSYTIGLARELQTEGIRVNCVSPGFTSTKINNFASGGKTAKDGAKVLLPWALMNEMDSSTGDLL